MSSFTGSKVDVGFSKLISIPFTTLSTLGDTLTATSTAIDNSMILYSEALININVTGTALSTAWLEARVLASTDGGLTYVEFNNGYVLPPVTLIVSPTIWQARILLPEYWKLSIRNVTGAALTAGTAFYQGVRR